MGTVAKVAIVLVLFVVSFLGFQAVSVLGHKMTPEEKQAALEKSVADMKKTLPQQVHPMVTWFDVEAGPSTIIYKYEVKASRYALEAKRSELESQLKNSPLLWAAKLTIPADTTLQFKLYDENRSYVYTLELE